MAIDLVCYMVIQGSTLNLEHLCGKNIQPIILNTPTQVVDNQLLDSYRRMSFNETIPIRNRLLELSDHRPSIILRDVRNICSSNPRFREILYRTRLSLYRGMQEGDFLVSYNRIIYVLATTYHC